ncbi:MAG: Efflux transporter periplasmic adaptor subunit [Cyanobacteriota bacterium erpe_2018_sw_21hr_WHONDRS-SW48-000092_B_bin.40]|jgi:HlyD family secretion protein|nr:Efflux transporter periplasmic adaptor subunit [Cyanobacteriota bacterium erpe_2018_sw_21hr_WHONDRS-SW48-000092_B_bin.40]
MTIQDSTSSLPLVSNSMKAGGPEKQKPKVLIWAAIALAIVAAGAYYFFFGQSKVDSDWKKNTVQVKRTEADITVVATGIIRPEREVKISPKTTGLLKELLVRQGERVKRGQLLARMDDSNLVGQAESAKGAYLAALDNYEKMKAGNRPQEVAASFYQEQKARQGVNNSERNISRLKAQMEATRATLARDEQFALTQAFLANNGAISDQDRINAQTQARVSRSNLLAAESELAQAQMAKSQSETDLSTIKQQNNMMKSGFRREDIAAAQHNAAQAKGSLTQIESLMRDTRILAPFDGIITQKYADAGAIVTPTTSSSTTSATSSSIVALAGRLEMVAQVSEANITKIKVGQAVEITATASPDKVFHGRVTQIAPAAIVTTNVTTFEVHSALLEHAEDELLAGMNVSATFKVGHEDNALTVPAVCVVSRKGQAGVFVPDAKGEPQFKEIKTGASLGRTVIVLSGLKEGDLVMKGLNKAQLGAEGYGGAGGRGGRGTGGAPGGGGSGVSTRGFGR